MIRSTEPIYPSLLQKTIPFDSRALSYKAHTIRAAGCRIWAQEADTRQPSRNEMSTAEISTSKPTSSANSAAQTSEPPSMGYFRFEADRIPVALTLTLTALDFAMYFWVQSVPLLCLYLVLFLVPKIGLCARNHHHQHVLTFRSVALNRLLEISYALHTGMTTNAWVLHHNLGHHVNYLDQSKDESGWKREDGSTMGEWEYTAKTALGGYVKAQRNTAHHPKYRTAFYVMTALIVALLSALIWYDWVNAVILFIAPMAMGYLMTCYHTYSHHAGLDSDDPYEASYNTLNKPYNFLTGNLGYHTAHHIKPGLHWSKLPEFHASIADRIPGHLYREPGILMRWFARLG